MNRYLVYSLTDGFGSSIETEIKADYMDVDASANLRFYMKDTFETVALFAAGCWSLVTKETEIE